jgi:hypothetical protein
MRALDGVFYLRSRALRIGRRRYHGHRITDHRERPLLARFKNFALGPRVCVNKHSSRLASRRAHESFWPMHFFGLHALFARAMNCVQSEAMPR